MTTAELVERLRNATPADHDNCPELSHIAGDWIEAAEGIMLAQKAASRDLDEPVDYKHDWDKTLAAVRSRLEAMK